MPVTRLPLIDRDERANQIVAPMAGYLAIDVGGTNVKYGLIGVDRALATSGQMPTPPAGGQDLVDEVLQLVRDVTGDTQILGVGVSTAGTVDRHSGRVIFAGPTIPAYANVAWKDQLRNVTAAPVYVDNDVVAALLGELWVGAARGLDDVYCLTLGTGIGGAYYRGSAAAITELPAPQLAGFMLRSLDDGTCYETRASTRALTMLAEKSIGRSVGAADVFDGARAGDARCVDVLQRWALQVSRGIAEIILCVAPRWIVIGGAISAQGNFLLQPIRKNLTRYLPSRSWRTELKTAELGNRAALYGAVYPFFKEQ